MWLMHVFTIQAQNLDNDPLILSDEQEYQLAPHSQFFLADNWLVPDTVQWTESQGATLNFSYTEQVAQIKIRFINQSQSKHWNVIVPNPLLDSLKFNLYEIDKGIPLLAQEQWGGVGAKRKGKDAFGRIHGMELNLESGKAYELQVLAKSKTGLRVPLILEPSTELVSFTQDSTLRESIIFGALIIGISYIFMIAFIFKFKSYTIYGLFLINTLVIFTNATGWLVYAFPSIPSNFWINLYPATFGISIFTSVIFLSKFLELGNIAPKLNKAFLIYGYGSALITPFALITGASALFPLADLLATIAIFWCLAVSVYCVKNGVMSAWYILMGWSVYLAGSLVFLLVSIGLLPYSDLAALSPLYGTLLMMVVIVLAFSTRVKQIENLRKAELKDALQSQRTLTDKIQVEKKTIQKANDEIAVQNEELISLNEEVVAQREATEKQKTVIDKMYKNTQSSIGYAEKIQSAILPSDEQLKEKLGEFGLCFLPKDRVSGDFFRIDTVDQKTIIIVADCTGHGVPGGYMSMLSSTLLDKIINAEKVTNPHDILERLDQEIKKVLHHNGSIRDGLDASIIMIDEETQMLAFAGARNGFFLKLKGLDFEYVKGTKRGIGDKRFKRPFSVWRMSLENIEQAVLITDGIIDQFGGSNGQKLGKAGLINWIKMLDNKGLSAWSEGLRELFNMHLEEGKEKQLDDICVMGVSMDKFKYGQNKMLDGIKLSQDRQQTDHQMLVKV
jgi:serine phosphatase RsbU (regulator of sigma subunit)